MYTEDRNDLPTGTRYRPGANMTVLLKWVAVVFFAGIIWLVGIYTDEYFRPYKKVDLGFRKS
jgi:hypothetical protein